MHYDDKEGVMAIVTTIVVVLVGIAAIMYLSEHLTCFNWFGMAKGCTITR